MLIIAAKLFFFDNFPASSGLNNASSVSEVPRIKTQSIADDNPLFPAAGEASAEENNENFFEAEDESIENKNNIEDKNDIDTNEDENNTKIDDDKSPVLDDKSAANNTANITVTKTPVNNNKAEQTRNARQSSGQKTGQKAQTPQVVKNQQSQAQWRVQVGAYGSKKAADEIIAKLAKAGYTATHYAVSKYHKVWVQAGSTKQNAEAVAEKLKKIGYPGSYVIPPPVRK